MVLAVWRRASTLAGSQQNCTDHSMPAQFATMRQVAPSWIQIEPPW
jgi:hypothetical protein